MRAGRRFLVVILVLVPALVFVGVGTLWSWTEAKNRVERKVSEERKATVQRLAAFLLQSTQEQMKLALGGGVQAYLSQHSASGADGNLADGEFLLPAVKATKPLVVLFDEFRQRVYPPASKLRSLDEVKQGMRGSPRRNLERALSDAIEKEKRASLLTGLATNSASAATEVQARYWLWRDALRSDKPPSEEMTQSLLTEASLSFLSSAQIVQICRRSLAAAIGARDRKLAQQVFEVGAQHLLPRCNLNGPGVVWMREILNIAGQELSTATKAVQARLEAHLEALEWLAEQGVTGPPTVTGPDLMPIALVDGLGFAQAMTSRGTAMVLPPRRLRVGDLDSEAEASREGLAEVRILEAASVAEDAVSVSLAPLRPNLALVLRASTGRGSGPSDWWQLPLFLLACLLLMGLGVALMVRSQQRESALLRDRREFLATVAHQLKTPVANLRMFSETLARGDVPAGEDRKRMEAILQSESEKLGEYLERVLAVTRLDRQDEEIPASLESVDLAAVLHEAKKRFARRAAAREVSIDLHIAINEPSPLVVADPRALEDAIHNVLDNAIRLTRESTAVVITHQLEGSEVVVRVKDSGPGIPIEHQALVFDAYYRGRTQDTRSGQGTGLGLAIARHAMTACGGTLAIESTGPAGTTMRFDFPVRSN